jgi:basic membrane lipoprotein Med (substrate-binding protein (PBP1-ABC) superfamily)/DNA-binding SARP family transcriptional activator
VAAAGERPAGGSERSSEAARAAHADAAYPPAMRFEVLGHLRARAVGATVASAGSSDAARSTGGAGAAVEPSLGGPKQRLVLALLLARPNEVVSTDRLIDGLWGDDVPSTARHTLQGYVSELRKAVGPALEREGNGYRVVAGAGELDALEFEALVSAGIAAAPNDPSGAAAALRRALDLWQGRPFGEFEDHDDLAAEVARLDELRLSAVEELMRAELALGHHGAVVGELERLTQAHPYREELRALHMLALYRSGRQADALRAYQRTRRVLAGELGIDPSPALARLEEQILVQDAALDLVEGPPLDGVAAPTGPAENPYKGLQPFREDDRDAFFGRAGLVEQIVATIDGGAAVVGVVGPSGSGKSSVIQAGVVPAVRDRAGARLLVATMQPGAHPFADLEAALVRAASAAPADSPPASPPAAPPVTLMALLREGPEGLLRAALRILPGDDHRLLLVVDQFEELFTLVGERERQAFLRLLTGAADDPRARVQAIIALRADFYDRPLAHPEFGRVFTQHVVHVLPLTADQLQDAAVLPARRAGLTVEPRLLASLVADVRDQPNALPLFQYALTELFDRREGSTLTLAGYQAFGGLRRAVANRAEELYGRLDREQQEAARQLFLRLVAVAGDDEGRRRIPASELTALEVDVVALQAAIEAFGRHRLLTLDRDPATGAPTVEVAHEALLREWKRLRAWLDAARTDLRTHRGFSAAVEQWVSAGRDPDYLLAGGRLAEAERWAASTTLRLTVTEREFLDAGVARREEAAAAEEQRQAAETRLRRGARRRTWALAAALAALAGVVGGILLTGDGGPRPTIGMFGFERGNDIDDLAIGGFERAARERDFEPAIFGLSLADPEEALDQLADEAGLVVYGMLGRAVLSPEVVADHPDTAWVVFDPPAEQVPGVSTFSFAVHEGAFLVGAAAALESETGVIGFVGGQQFPQLEAFRAGYEAGARAVDPGVEVLAGYVAAGPWLGFDDPDRAREIAAGQYERGADVVFHAAGMSGYGVFEAADEASDALGRHLWAIGVDNDQYVALPQALREHTLTSMIKRFDVGVYETVISYLDGTLEPGNRVFTLADGGVGFSTSGNHMAPATIERLEELEAQIVAGARTVPHVPAGPLDPPLGGREPVGVTVTWDGRTCTYDGPPDWSMLDVMRIDLVNAAGAPAQMWVMESEFALPYVGVEAAPGGHSVAQYEIRDDPPVAISCIPVVDGRPDLAGRVEAAPIEVAETPGGTYTTERFEVPLTYTVPPGWEVFDSTGGVGFDPPGWQGWPPLVVVSGVVAADETCAPRAQPGVDATAAGIARYLAGHPGLDTSAPQPVGVGGLSGQVIELRQVEGWTGTCDFTGDDPAVPTVLRPDSPDQWVQPAGYEARYYLLDVPGGGVIVVDVEVEGDRADWDRVFAQVEPILDSFAFAPPTG